MTLSCDAARCTPTDRTASTTTLTTHPATVNRCRRSTISNRFASVFNSGPSIVSPSVLDGDLLLRPSKPSLIHLVVPLRRRMQSTPGAFKEPGRLRERRKKRFVPEGLRGVMRAAGLARVHAGQH